MNSNIVLSPIVFEQDSIRRTSSGLISVFDLIRVVGGQKSPREVWTRITARYPEVVSFCDNLKFPGSGQRDTPATDKEGALKIIGLLPGEAGKKYRAEAAKLVLQWYEAPEELAIAAFDRIKDKKTIERTKVRIDGITARKIETFLFASTGVVTEPKHYAHLTNTTYEALLGDTCKGLKKTRGLSDKDSLRDSLVDIELTALSLAEQLAANRIAKNPVGSFQDLESVVRDCALKVSPVLVGE